MLRDKVRAWFGRRETRANYHDAITTALVQAASGTGTVTAAATGALEVAAGLWGRCFAAAVVDPAGGRTRALTPGILSLMGRQLCRAGEAVLAIDVVGGEIRLLPAWSWDVYGGPMEAPSYRVHLAGPSQTVSRTLPAAAVVHTKYAVDPIRPWAGIGPLTVAAQTGRLSGALERALADEATGPRGTLITAPETSAAKEDADGEVLDPFADLKADLANLRGQLAVVESFAAGAGDRGLRPDRDWKPERLGADPPSALVSLRQDVADSVLQACGISPALYGGGGATGGREALRAFYRTTLLPVAALVEHECSAKLETDVRLTFDSLAAADVATAARAYQSLSGAGMPDADARRLAGLA